MRDVKLKLLIIVGVFCLVCPLVVSPLFALQQVGNFEVYVAGDNENWNILDASASVGDAWSDGQGTQWFKYPQDADEALVDIWGNTEQAPEDVAWWNEWWYDDPYDKDRVKIISLTFGYDLLDGITLTQGYAVVTVNWSTTDWSLNPPPGVDPSQQPPLEDFDPVNPSVPWVGRMDIITIPIGEGGNPPGDYTLTDFELPIPYNPEWVSIDIRGYNFKLTGGQLTHECVFDSVNPPVKIEQLDWKGSSTSTPDSNWGRITLDYNRPAGIYYFNLGIEDGIGGSQWVVENLSIESLGGDQTLMTYFDLLVAHGTDVSALKYDYSIDITEIPAGPTATTPTFVSDLDFQIGGMKGKDTGSPGTANADPDANVAVAGSDPNSGVIPDKDKFVNQPQDPNYCAPGAMSNSLKYLQARGKIPASVPTSISDLAGVLGTTSAGTPPDGWYLKKATRYKKYVTTRTIEAPLDYDKVLELIKELKDGQDIEVELDGHVEVLIGMRLNPDGTVDMDLADDNQTDDKSDPIHTSSLRGTSATQYVDGKKLVRFIIECPKETVVVGTPYFSLNTKLEWESALSGEYAHASIVAMTLPEWGTYMDVWNTLDPEVIQFPDKPYGEPEFLPSLPGEGLYVYEGDGEPGDEWPEDGGLVMGWGLEGDPLVQDADYASAFKVEYSEDPDLSNCIITVAVTAPVGITQVSLGLETPLLGSGNIRSWYWTCGVGPGFDIQSTVATTITIDTSITSTAAASPLATNYISAGGFSITNVLWILVDENATWVGVPTSAPPPGGPLVGMWNYWHWLMVSPKTTLSKALLAKHSQGPIIIDTSTGGDPAVPLFWGWDEKSNYHMGPIAADDWLCEDKRPVTDFHWWGSFPGWTDPYPPCHPVAFHIGIWTDAPVGVDNPWSHPKELVWEHICDNSVWNFAGYDRDPRNFDKNDPAGGTAGGNPNPIPGDDPAYEPNDACFQYNQLLDGDDWFYQDTDGEPNRIYWLSIAPIWDEDCEYEWGWKTRPKFFMDNAVSITAVTDALGTTTSTWPPVLGSLWSAGVPLQIPAYTPLFPNHGDAISWDLAFEISTNEKAYEDDPIPGDTGGPNGVGPDGVVNVYDLLIVAQNWLKLAPLP